MNEKWWWQLTYLKRHYLPLMKHIMRHLRKSEQQELLEVLQSQQQQEIKSLAVVTRSQARKQVETRDNQSTT